MRGMRRSGRDTVWDLYRRRADRDPPHGSLVVLDDDGGMRSSDWPEVAGRAAAAADQLASLGVRRGDRVALLGRNSTRYPELLGATARLGAIAVPLNVELTAPELAFQIVDTEPTAIVAEVDLAPRADAALVTSAAGVERMVCGGEVDGWRTLETGEGDPDARAEQVDPMDPFQILFTSGTTDRPKGVVQSHLSVLEEAQRQAYQWALRPDDVLYSQFPFFHNAGQHCALFPAMTVGASLVTGPRFHAGRWAADIRRTGSTVAVMVGPQLRMIMNQVPPAEAENSLRLVCYGLAVPAEMEAAFSARFDVPLYALSGSTETVSVSYQEPVFGEHRWPSLGRPTAGKEVLVVDEDGAPVPPGTNGELWVRGEPGVSLMLGYWNRPEATAEAIVDGWFRTGDIGRMDGDGFVYFVDRKKDVIKHSGENVSSAEVERVIGELPGVAEVAVVGRPDPIRDEAIVAFVRTEVDVPVEAIRSHCVRNLARFKVPEEIRIIDEFPHTSLGKIEKKVLRELARKAG